MKQKNQRSQTLIISLYWLLVLSACSSVENKPKFSELQLPQEEKTSQDMEDRSEKATDGSSNNLNKQVPRPLIAEPKTPVIAANLDREPNQSNTEDSLQAIPLDYQKATKFVDIRGVGDSAMALTHQQPLSLTQRLPQGVAAHFGQRLDAFDRSGKSYRGDLSFINWESTVGTFCNRFWSTRGPRSFAFVSHPDNMSEIYKRGFNLIGLANNHTRDCPSAEEGVDGAYASARHLERLSNLREANWLWHGVGTDKKAKVKTMTIEGKPIKVAFASLYLAEGDCTYVSCLKDELTVLRSLRDADADIRILSLHSWTASTQKQLVNMGVNFISYYNGDIVFGHGPHRSSPVRIVESPTGKRGVLFESLGNFIHPSLIPSSQHIIGRVLLDLDSLQLRQVQIIPISVNRAHVSFSGTPNPTKFPANLNWKFVNNSTWQSGVSSSVKGAYSNIKSFKQ